MPSRKSAPSVESSADIATNGHAANLDTPAELAERFHTLQADLHDTILWEARADTMQFTYVSSGAAHVLGYPAERWLAEPDFWERNLHPDDRARALSDGFDDATELEQERVHEYRMIAADGSLVWLRDRAFAVRNSAGQVHFRGLMQDITEQKRVEARLNAQYAISRILAESQTLQEATPKILEGICRSLDAEIAAVWVPDEGSGSLRLEYMWSSGDIDVAPFRRASKAVEFRRGVGLPGRVWETGQLHWITDLLSDDNFPRGSCAAEIGLRSGIGFPIMRGGDLLGVIEFFSRFTQHPNDDLLYSLAAVGRQIGLFVNRKQAEENLKKSQEQLSDLIENALAGVHWIGPDGTLIWANRAELDMLGYTAEEYIGHDIAEFHTDPDVIKDILRRLATGEDLQAYEAQMRCKDGSTRHVLIESNVLWEDGKFVHTRCFTLDITDRKNAEDLLRLSELSYKSLFDNNLDAVFSFDLAGNFTSANPACERLSGYSRDELREMHFADLVVPEDFERAQEHYIEAVNGEPQNLELAILNRGGERLVLNITGVPIVINNATVGIFAIAKDVTERRRAEQALRDGEKRLRLAMEAGRMGAWEWDIRTSDVHWSEGLEAIHGIPAGSFGGTFEAYLSDVHSEDRERVVASITDAVTRGEHDIEYRIVRPDGAVRWVTGRGQVIRDETGRPARLIGVCTDVTERKDVEDQLRRANEAKDEFLGLISHELRTPITTIYGGARLLHSRSGQLDTESQSSLLADIESESERLHRLVEDLLVLSRLELNQRVATEPILLQHVINKAAEASKKRSRHVSTSIRADFPAVTAEPTYLDQVLRNLISNAEKYSTPGEPIEIAVTRNDANEAVVTVSDHGPGIPDDEAERIFERFFRSKHTAGKVGGAGIGLTVCKRLIEAQAGRIWANTREDGGLAVSFALPLSEEVIE